MGYLENQAAKRQQHLEACANRRKTRLVRNREVAAADGETLPLPPGADREYSIALAALEQQLATLKSQYSDHAERNRHLPPILNSVKQYLTDWIASGKTHQNDVLIKAVVMACDTGEWDLAIEYTDIAVKHNMQSGMKRNLPTFVADAIRIAHVEREKTAIAQGDALQPFELPEAFYTVLERIANEQWAVEFIAQTKNQKMAGLASESRQDWANAEKYYELAHRDPTRGVKGRLEKAKAKQVPVQE